MFSLLIIPVAVALITQIIKLITDGIPNNLTWQHLLSDYGGMPSSHSALAASLATIVGLEAGWDSASFAVAFILMIFIIRDAVGFRREIGKNAVLTNMLAKEMFPKNPEILVHERIGHTAPQVIAGLILGVILTYLFYWIMMVV